MAVSAPEGTRLDDPELALAWRIATRRCGRPRTRDYDALKQVRSIKAKTAQLQRVEDVLDNPAPREIKGLEKVRRDLEATMTALGEAPTPEVAAKILAKVGRILSVVQGSRNTQSPFINRIYKAVVVL